MRKKDGWVHGWCLEEICVTVIMFSVESERCWQGRTLSLWGSGQTQILGPLLSLFPNRRYCCYSRSNLSSKMSVFCDGVVLCIKLHYSERYQAVCTGLHSCTGNQLATVSVCGFFWQLYLCSREGDRLRLPQSDGVWRGSYAWGGKKGTQQNHQNKPEITAYPAEIKVALFFFSPRAIWSDDTSWHHISGLRRPQPIKRKPPKADSLRDLTRARRASCAH